MKKGKVGNADRTQITESVGHCKIRFWVYFNSDLILDPRLASLGDVYKPYKKCRKCFSISRVFCKAVLWISGLWLTSAAIGRYIERHNRYESIDVMKTVDRSLENVNGGYDNRHKKDHGTNGHGLHPDVAFPIISFCLHSPHSRKKR